MVDRLCRVLVLALWLAASVPGVASSTPTGGYRVEYAGYTHGFLVLRLSGSLALTPAGYDVRVAFRTAGLAGMVVSVDSESHAVGRFSGGMVQPSLFEASGHLRGAMRVTRIAYAGGNPAVQVLTPPVEHERGVVPLADTRQTIDTLSAAVLLIRQSGEGAPCAGTVRTFDGRRLAVQSAHGAAPDLLGPTARSIFAGRAQRCEIEGRQLAGFVRTENEDELRRPRRGTAWLADMLADAPPVPVRIVFEHRLLGQVTLYLTALTLAK